VKNLKIYYWFLAFLKINTMKNLMLKVILGRTTSSECSAEEIDKTKI